MDPLLSMTTTHIPSIYPLLNIIKRGLNKDPTDRVTWRAHGAHEPPNLQDTEIRCS